jgi:hypothetical protein
MLGEVTFVGKYLAEICDKKCRVKANQILDFVKLILFLKTYLEGGLAPSSQTVGSLFILPGQQNRPEK